MLVIGISSIFFGAMHLPFVFKKYLSVNCLANDGNVLTLGRLEIGDTVYLFFFNLYRDIYCYFLYEVSHKNLRNKLRRFEQ